MLDNSVKRVIGAGGRLRSYSEAEIGQLTVDKLVTDENKLMRKRLGLHAAGPSPPLTKTAEARLKKETYHYLQGSI